MAWAPGGCSGVLPTLVAALTPRADAPQKVAIFVPPFAAPKLVLFPRASSAPSTPLRSQFESFRLYSLCFSSTREVTAWTLFFRDCCAARPPAMYEEWNGLVRRTRHMMCAEHMMCTFFVNIDNSPDEPLISSDGVATAILRTIWKSLASTPGGHAAPPPPLAAPSASETSEGCDGTRCN